MIKFLWETEQPFWCAGIYTAAIAFFALLTGHSIGYIFLNSIIVGALASLYFWLLDKTMGMGVIFWVVAFVGLAIGLV
ncbi:MAG: hypothetical protein GY839_21035 [candidate division Zixibacteria bacterium]|nr:hypothetical protein [candidate division Zixibacteria bacterium]